MEVALVRVNQKVIHGKEKSQKCKKILPNCPIQLNSFTIFCFDLHSSWWYRSVCNCATALLTLSEARLKDLRYWHIKGSTIFFSMIYYLTALLFPSIPFHFFPHFSKNRRVEGNSNFKIAISFHFCIDFKNCYFLPFQLLFPSILWNYYFLPFLTKMMNTQWAGQIKIWGFLAKSWRLSKCIWCIYRHLRYPSNSYLTWTNYSSHILQAK